MRKKEANAMERLENGLKQVHAQLDLLLMYSTKSTSLDLLEGSLETLLYGLCEQVGELRELVARNADVLPIRDGNQQVTAPPGTWTAKYRDAG